MKLEYSPPGSRGYWGKVRSAGLDEVSENICPVIPRVPRDAVWRVNFYRHDLADLAALDEDHRTANAAALAAPVLATPDVVCDERIVVGDVGSGNDVSALHEEPDVIGKRLGFSHACYGAHLLLGSLEGR